MRLDPTFLLAWPGFLLGVIAHERAHAWVARCRGDDRTPSPGRSTFDPLAHVDPVGTLLVPALLALTGTSVPVGWARPVPIDRARLRDLRNDPVRIALAGPAANLMLAVGFAAVARVAPEVVFGLPLRGAATAGVATNLALAAFHLLPIPPLDGAWIATRFLRLRPILTLHALRGLAGAGVAVVLLVPAARAELRAPLAAAVHVCLALFGTPPSVVTP